MRCIPEPSMAPPFHCSLDRHSGVPVYRQLVEQVRFQVAAGALAEGDELPSTRALSSEHGVNPMTVSKAYAELERLGVIERRPGRPSVVATLAEGAQASEGLDQLRSALAPAVSAARQLAVSTDEAVRVFRELLAPPED